MPIDTPTWEDTVEEVPKWEETVEGGAESQEQLDRWAAEAWKSQPKTGFFGSFGKEFVGSIKSTARGPGPVFLSENVLKDHLLGEYAKATTAPEQTGAGKIGGFLGGLAGTIGQAIPIGMATGPAGIIAMFGSQGEYNEFLRAGMRALSEGKSPEEAVKIGRKSGLVGGAVGSALGAIMPAKPAATLAEAVAHGVKLGAAAALGRGAENVGERVLGLKTPVGEDVLTEGLTMAALPPAGHVVGRALRIVKPPRQPEVPAAPLPNEAQQLEAIRTEIGKASRAVDIAKGIGDIDEALRAQVRLDLLLEHERKIESMVPAVAAEPTVPPKPSGAAVVPPMQTTDVVAPAAAPLTAQEIYALQRGQERGRIVPQPPKKEIQPPMRGPEEEPPPAGEPVPVEPKPPEGPAPAGATAEQPAAKAAEPEKGVEPDALQVKSTDEIPVQPTPRDRGAVAEGVPPEGEVAAGEKAQVGPEKAEVLLSEPTPSKPAEPVAGVAKADAELESAKDAAQSAYEKLGAAENGAYDKSKRKGMTKAQLAKLAAFDKLVEAEKAAKAKAKAVKQPAAEPAAKTGELPKAQPGERRKTLKEIREQNKLGGQGGFINLSPVVDAVDRLRNEIDIWFKQGKVKQAMSFKKDRANNMADRYANEHGNDVSNMLFRALKGTIKPSQQERLQAVFAPWKDPNELYKTALTVGVESFSDALPNSGEVGVTGRSRLALQRARLQTYTPPDATMARWKNKGLAAIDYAIANWNRLEPVVQRYMREMRAEADFEQAKGVDTLIRNGYVMHETDLEGRSRFDFLNPHGGGEGARWLKNRIYPTYVDKIIGNSKPVSMDAIALAKARIRSGQRKVNNAEWTQNLRNEVDPTSGKPILTDAIERTRADGKHYYDPIDQDYTLARIGYETYSVHKGYDGAFEALTDPSWFSRSLPGQSLMKLAGSTKHVVLAFDTFHLGRLAFWSSIIQGKPAGYKKGLVLLNYTMPEIQEMARRGEIPREYLADIAENKRKIDLAMKTGFNVARIQDALWQEWTQKIPGTGAFQKWLFGEFQQGAMMESWLAEFSRQKKAFSWLSEDKIARNVSKELNTRFGNLQNQGWFRSKTAQDLARLIFLAPQWNEGLIMSELKGLAGVGKTLYDAQTRQKLAVSGLTRAAGIMMLAQFAANQLINLVSRGHPTWENKEDGLDAKLSAYIPDYIGEGPGLFWSPMALPAETAHLLYKMHERTGDMDEAINSYARSRLGTVTRPIATWAFKKDAFGRSIRSEELWNEILKSAVPAPISGSAAYYAGRQVATGEKSEQFPGQFQKQSLASLGVKTETAPTATQQIGRLARKWNEARGKLPPGEFYSSPYTDLDRLLRAGNTRDALRQLDDLVKKKNLDQIFKRYEFMAEMNFTHSSEDDEADFFNTLTKDQRDAYLKARMERAQLADRFYKLWAIRQSTQPATR